MIICYEIVKSHDMLTVSSVNHNGVINILACFLEGDTIDDISFQINELLTNITNYPVVVTEEE
jgi:hypothetical protein